MNAPPTPVAALGLFWLSRRVLRTALGLYRRRLISRVDLPVALAIANLLDRSAVALMFGSRKRRRQKRDRTNQL
jgi:hypothetical protein